MLFHPDSNTHLEQMIFAFMGKKSPLSDEHPLVLDTRDNTSRKSTYRICPFNKSIALFNYIPIIWGQTIYFYMYKLFFQFQAHCYHHVPVKHRHLCPYSEAITSLKVHVCQGTSTNFHFNQQKQRFWIISKNECHIML